MLEQMDIEESKKLFKEWDNNKTWNSPTPAFLEYSKKSNNLLPKTVTFIYKIIFSY